MSIIMNNKKLFSTTDFNTIVVLSYFNYKIEKMDKENPKRTIFYFKIDKNLEIILNRFWKKELLVEPLVFFSLIKEIKSRIYET